MKNNLLTNKLPVTFFCLIISFLFFVPVWASSESIADYKIVAGGKTTNAKVSQLIYYLEKFEANYTFDKSDTKWITSKKYVDDKVIITDNLTSKNPSNEPITLLGYTMEFQTNPKESNTVILNKITTSELDGSEETKGKDLEELIKTAQQNNFELPKPKKELTSENSLQDPKNISDIQPQTTSENKTLDFFSYLKIGAVIAGILVLLYIFSGYSTACPQCKKWFMADLQSKKELNRRNSHKTVTETTTHRNRDGKVTGTSEKKKQVPITLVKYERNYMCKDCNYKWLDTVEEEV